MAKLYFVGGRIFYDDDVKIFFLNGYIVYSIISGAEPEPSNVLWMSWF